MFESNNFLSMHKVTWLLVFVLFSGCMSDRQELHTDIKANENIDMSAANKEIAHSFYKRVIGQLDEAFVDSIIADDYIQHNPMVKTGKAGILEAIAYLKQMPRPENPKSPIVRSFAEGDFVVLHLNVNMGPSSRAVIDLFRIENGIMVEHWDVMENNAGTMTDGTIVMDIEVESAESKQLLASYYDEVVIGGNLESLPNYVEGSVIQHDPLVKDGIVSLKAYLEDDATSVRIEKVHRLIAEHDYVVAQLEGVFNGLPHAVYDIARVENGKIAEQWRVKQAIPGQMMHNNGMF